MRLCPTIVLKSRWHHVIMCGFRQSACYATAKRSDSSMLDKKLLLVAAAHVIIACYRSLKLWFAAIVVNSSNRESEIRCIKDTIVCNTSQIMSFIVHVIQVFLEKGLRSCSSYVSSMSPSHVPFALKRDVDLSHPRSYRCRQACMHWFCR